MGRRSAATATPRSVRVYTVNDESRYVVARGLPAVGVRDEALKRLSLFGEIVAHRALSPTAEEQASFTESLWVQYETVTNARHAKAKAKQKPVVGSVLHVAYAPQDETPEDTAQKLRERRELIERRAMPRSYRESGAGQQRSREEAEEEEAKAEFIGPRLPPRAAGSTTTTTQVVPRTAVDRSKRRRI